MGRIRYTAAQFIKAIPGTGGIITAIAQRVGCEWNTAKKWIFDHPTVRRAYDDECEKVVDAAESVIVGDIVDNKEVTTAKWYLMMKGAERGYTQTRKHEVTGKDGGALTLHVVYEDDDRTDGQTENAA